MSQSKELQEVYFSGRTLSYEYRLGQLQQISEMLLAMRDEYEAAALVDMGRHPDESYFNDLRYADHELGHTIKHLRQWMTPTPVKTDAAFSLERVQLHPEPRGVVLIFGAWNYPLQLLLIPLIGAVAAGCCAVVKPSEVSANAGRVIAKYLREYLDSTCFRVEEGGVDRAEALLEQRWDHIFFTGSTSIGRRVAMKAAETLTSVTLELGGKSPCIVDETANISSAANRIVYGKFMNGGQICIAADYVIVHETRAEELVSSLREALTSFYGSDASQSPEFCRLITGAHFQRLRGQLERCGGEVVHGGRVDEESKFIEPTLVTGVDFSSPIMDEELFGPILPILTYRDLPGLLHTLKRREKPLVTYLFSTHRPTITAVERELSCGTLSVNDTITFVCIPQLPFGGVGNSGQGRYHGKASFDSFTNYKGVHERAAGMEVANMIRYPPYTDNKRKAKDWFYSLVLYSSRDELRALSWWRQNATKLVGVTALVALISMRSKLPELSSLPIKTALSSVRGYFNL